MESQKENNNLIINQIETTHLEFLKVAIEPFSKILEAWEQTYKLRKRLYLNVELQKIFNDFPCLRLNSGIELVNNTIFCIILFC